MTESERERDRQTEREREIETERERERERDRETEREIDRDSKREMDIRTECGTISYLLSLLLLLSCPGYDSVCHLQFEFIIYKYI